MICFLFMDESIRFSNNFSAVMTVTLQIVSPLSFISVLQCVLVCLHLVSMLTFFSEAKLNLTPDPIVGQD